MTDKQIAAETLARLPETVTLAEIADELQMVAAIHQGQADVAAGRVRPHQEVKQLFAPWTERCTTQPSVDPDEISHRPFRERHSFE